MAPRHLRLKWSTELGRTTVLVRGDVDGSAQPDFDAIAIVADGTPGIVIDLDDLGFVDAVGVDLLDDLARRSNVQICNPTAPLIQLLRRTDGVIGDWDALRAALTHELD